MRLKPAPFGIKITVERSVIALVRQDVADHRDFEVGRRAWRTCSTLLQRANFAALRPASGAFDADVDIPVAQVLQTVFAAHPDGVAVAGRINGNDDDVAIICDSHSVKIPLRRGIAEIGPHHIFHIHCLERRQTRHGAVSHSKQHHRVPLEVLGGPHDVTVRGTQDELGDLRPTLL